MTKLVQAAYGKRLKEVQQMLDSNIDPNVLSPLEVIIFIRTERYPSHNSRHFRWIPVTRQINSTAINAALIQNASTVDEIKVLFALVMNGGNPNIKSSVFTNVCMSMDEVNNFSTVEQNSYEFAIARKEYLSAVVLALSTVLSDPTSLARMLVYVQDNHIMEHIFSAYINDERLREISLLFSKHVEKINPQTIKGQNALLVAAILNLRDTITLLLKKGIDPNICDPSTGNCSLHYILQGMICSRDICKDLIFAGADINKPNKSGVTPLQLCKTDSMRNMLLSARDEVKMRAIAEYEKANSSSWFSCFKSNTAPFKLATDPIPYAVATLETDSQNRKSFEKLSLN